MTKTALITGVTGQDGSYLTELLLHKGYEVHGLVHLASTSHTSRIDHIHTDPHAESKLILHYGNLSVKEQISNIICNIKPSEVYHLGAQSHVRMSFDMPEYTGNVTGLATGRLLETIRKSGQDIRFYQASCSEMFGATPPPQNEETKFLPRSPYACAKLYAYFMAKNYRDGYNMYVCNGILFNHESPRRDVMSVTRLITRGLANIVAGKEKYLSMGNLDARRDWGFSPEYVEAMWMMLQQDKPDDYVVSTGQSNSVKEFIEEAFTYAGLNWEDHVKIDPKYFRPTEVEDLIGDASKSKKILKWQAKVTFKDLTHIMVDSDLRAAGLAPIGEGDAALAKLYPDKWWGVD